MELHQCFPKISSTADIGTPANNAYYSSLNMVLHQHSLDSYSFASKSMGLELPDVRHSSTDEFLPFSRRFVFELAS
jgi:hypothetical protein